MDGPEMNGLEEMARKLEELARRAEQLHGTHNVPVAELLTPWFLASCSGFASLDEMLQASGFNDFGAAPETDRDAFIKKNTSFDSWHKMLAAAAAAWTKKQLGLG